MSTPRPQSSPSGRGGAASTASSIPMTYSMDSDRTPPTLPSAVVAQQQQQQSRPSMSSSSSASPPPAYAFQRSERTSDMPGSSFATHTTEDSIMSGESRSVDYTEDSTPTPYDGQQHPQPPQSQAYQQQIRQQQMGAEEEDGNLNQYYQYQEATRQQNPATNLATVNEYHAAGLQGMNGVDPNAENESLRAEDATEIIYQMHKKLLHLLSYPESFHDALDWQDRLDRGDIPTATVNAVDGPSKNDISGLSNTLDDATQFDEDSTFQGLDANNGQNPSEQTATKHSQNETFEFNPNGNNDDAKETPKKESPANDAKEATPEPKQSPPLPLPHQIFASDAEVVLPQALTASQLFGIECVTGIELEAAAGIAGLSQLFLRWLALMPDGDHMNVIDPPGLTVMKISGGGYRVTGAHRVVWRWMNKFSPASTGNANLDFDFGDLVTMTIIDVFETDAHGQLLSYCPTFDNRAVHKTPEMAERLRKGASHLRERMEVAARSPAGKTVNKAAGSLGKMSIRAAIVVGNAVKNKIQHNKQSSQPNHGCNDLAVGEDQLEDLLQSQIAEDETELDIDGVNATALEDDPTSSPSRRMEV